MPHTITQSALLSNSLSVPSDAVDPVNEASVDPVFQKLLNNTYYIAQQQLYTRPYFTMLSTTGISVVIAPFYGVWVDTANGLDNWVAIDNSAYTTITAANLDTGMAFAANKPYYVYAFQSSPGVAVFECSLVAPDVRLTFKGTPDTSKRYIGSFTTEGTASIRQFSMDQNEYFCQAGATDTQSTTTNLTTAFDIISTKYPTTIKIVKILGTLTNSGVNITGDCAVVFYPDPFSNLYTLTCLARAQVLTKSLTNSFCGEVPLMSGGKLGTFLNSDTVNLATYTWTLIGYKE